MRVGGREGGTDRKRCVRLHGDLLLSSNKTHCTRENARARTRLSLRLGRLLLASVGTEPNTFVFITFTTTAVTTVITAAVFVLLRQQRVSIRHLQGLVEVTGTRSHQGSPSVLLWSISQRSTSKEGK